MIKKIGILTSGGDAPGMNAAIRAVTRTALADGVEVAGIRDGFKGLIEGKIENFNRRSVAGILQLGGTILGSARLPEFSELEVQKKAVKILEANGIDALVVIGGDGSYKGAMALTNLGVNCVGIPGTIDNDVPGTDYTIGFDTALNTDVEAIDRLRDTFSSHHRCSIVEVMGNTCGDLALYSAISCGAEIVVTNETGYDEEAFINKMKELNKTGRNHLLVIFLEKITDVNALCKKISEVTDYPARATVLGHIQRGGTPTPRDRFLGSQMGAKAVEALLVGRKGVCVIAKDDMIYDIPIDEALNTKRSSRKELYDMFEKLV